MDYTYNSVSISTDVSTEFNYYELRQMFDHRISFYKAWAELHGSTEENKGRNDSSKNILFALLAVNKYYETIDEAEGVEYVEDIAAVLQRLDFVSMVQMCGPHFVRSLTRTSEILTIMTYVSSQNEVAGSGQNVLHSAVMNFDIGMELLNDAEAFASESQLMVTVSGVGIDLSDGDNSPLLASNLEDYVDLMDSVYGMVGTPGVGTVASLEIVSWAHFQHFQQAVGLKDIMSYISGGRDKRYPDALKQLNFIDNAEHIASVERTARFKLFLQNTLSACLHELWGLSGLQRCRSYVLNKFNSTDATKHDDMSSFSESWNQNKTAWHLNERPEIHAERLKW
eukprot:CAMPEP_0113307260 /NCGR_PEP_ID=MMETSP0010_2-20120614/6177_1 /TAXON_ID=216773 ORGANISM="Corethron hystrix, Strain 308" /NCGR_SAMPLE_ID=MMETSP0010_2 /ASSEMBLY_ACC=CAM_ASM_000155 /LENGTH=338 /DNA_ID=CAMNT_0000162081 /DNA_START=342 /DNA_END=1355 /DNA_ORIENTATION=- /assembly_acc=CAM_ASM_000155